MSLMNHEATDGIDTVSIRDVDSDNVIMSLMNHKATDGIDTVSILDVDSDNVNVSFIITGIGHAIRQRTGQRSSLA